MENHVKAWIVAGVFCLLAILFSLAQMRLHLLWNSQSQLRKYVLRILMMVPIYALESWLGLRFKEASMYFDILRECYEAIVIYSFFQFLVGFLGGEDAVIAVMGSHSIEEVNEEQADDEQQQQQQQQKEQQQQQQQQQHGDGLEDEDDYDDRSLLEQQGDARRSRRSSSSAVGRDTHQKHMMPFCCLKPWRLGEHFYMHTKLGTLQYCVLRPLCAAITFILTAVGKYGEGELRGDRGYPYIAFIVNCSQMWAMYCLILFYMANKKELAPVKPVAKFMCVKSVVFFTFWQSVALAVLVKIGVIHSTETYTTDNVATGLQDFIVCIEMFFAAIAHHWAFSHRDFHDPSQPLIAPPLFSSMFDVVNVKDIYVDDVRHVIKHTRTGRRVARARQQGKRIGNGGNAGMTAAAAAAARRAPARFSHDVRRSQQQAAIFTNHSNDSGDGDDRDHNQSGRRSRTNSTHREESPLLKPASVGSASGRAAAGGASPLESPLLAAASAAVDVPLQPIH